MARWQPDDLFLREHYKFMSDAEIGHALGRSEVAVKQRRNVLGLNVRAKMWSTAEIQFVRDNYTTMTAKQLSAQLGRSPMAVAVKRNDLNLLVHVSKNTGRQVKKPIPRDWKPSHIPCEICDDVKRHVDLLKRVYGTYGGRT